MAALNCQRQGRYGYLNKHQSQSNNKTSLTCADIRHWLADHGVPRSDLDVMPTKFLIDL